MTTSDVCTKKSYCTGEITKKFHISPFIESKHQKSFSRLTAAATFQWIFISFYDFLYSSFLIVLDWFKSHKHNICTFCRLLHECNTTKQNTLHRAPRQNAVLLWGLSSMQHLGRVVWAAAKTFYAYMEGLDRLTKQACGYTGQWKHQYPACRAVCKNRSDARLVARLLKTCLKWIQKFQCEIMLYYHSYTMTNSCCRWSSKYC